MEGLGAVPGSSDRGPAGPRPGALLDRDSPQHSRTDRRSGRGSRTGSADRSARALSVCNDRSVSVADAAAGGGGPVSRPGTDVRWGQHSGAVGVGSGPDGPEAVRPGHCTSRTRGCSVQSGFVSRWHARLGARVSRENRCCEGRARRPARQTHASGDGSPGGVDVGCVRRSGRGMARARSRMRRETAARPSHRPAGLRSAASGPEVRGAPGENGAARSPSRSIAASRFLGRTRCGCCNSGAAVFRHELRPRIRSTSARAWPRRS